MESGVSLETNSLSFEIEVLFVCFSNYSDPNKTFDVVEIYFVIVLFSCLIPPCAEVKHITLKEFLCSIFIGRTFFLIH